VGAVQVAVAERVDRALQPGEGGVAVGGGRGVG
jgi:hypothetical protein